MCHWCRRLSGIFAREEYPFPLQSLKKRLYSLHHVTQNGLDIWYNRRLELMLELDKILEPLERYKMGPELRADIKNEVRHLRKGLGAHVNLRGGGEVEADEGDGKGDGEAKEVEESKGIKEGEVEEAKPEEVEEARIEEEAEGERSQDWSSSEASPALPNKAATWRSYIHRRDWLVKFMGPRSTPNTSQTNSKGQVPWHSHIHRREWVVKLMEARIRRKKNRAPPQVKTATTPWRKYIENMVAAKISEHLAVKAAGITNGDRSIAETNTTNTEAGTEPGAEAEAEAMLSNDALAEEGLAGNPKGDQDPTPNSQTTPPTNPPPRRLQKRTPKPPHKPFLSWLTSHHPHPSPPLPQNPNSHLAASTTLSRASPPFSILPPLQPSQPSEPSQPQHGKKSSLVKNVARWVLGAESSVPRGRGEGRHLSSGTLRKRLEEEVVAIVEEIVDDLVEGGKGKGKGKEVGESEEGAKS